jgi:hypothetical protein
MAYVSSDRRQAARWIVVLLVPVLEGLAGCSSSPLVSTDAGQLKDASRADSAADRNTTDASPCGETISAYCDADAGTCQTTFGPVLATDWTTELSKACATSARVYVATCGDYMVITLGGIDTSVTLYYLRSTGALVTIDETGFPQGDVCVAGASQYPAVCPTDPAPTSICKSDGAIDLGI